MCVMLQGLVRTLCVCNAARPSENTVCVCVCVHIMLQGLARTLCVCVCVCM